MVKVGDTLVTGTAVFGFWTHVHLAQKAVAVFDDVGMSGAIENRKWISGQLGSDAVVRRVDGDGHYVHKGVDKEHHARANVPGGDPVPGQQGDEHPEGADSEVEEEAPGHQLQGVGRPCPPIGPG